MQGAVTLSSGEAEYGAMLVGAVEGRAAQTLCQELGADPQLILCTDSSAAKGTAEKAGLLRMRHLEVKRLYLKELVQRGLLKIRKLASKANPANVFTKTLAAEQLHHELAVVAGWRPTASLHVVQVGMLESMSRYRARSKAREGLVRRIQQAETGLIWRVERVRRLIAQPHRVNTEIRQFIDEIRMLRFSLIQLTHRGWADIDAE